MAPAIPVKTTIPAVNSGIPPIFSEMPMAIGVVTLFGAKLMMVSKEAPNKAPKRMVEMIPVAQPTKTPIRSGPKV